MKKKLIPPLWIKRRKVAKVLKGGHVNKDFDISKVGEKDMPF